MRKLTVSVVLVLVLVTAYGCGSGVDRAPDVDRPPSSLPIPGVTELRLGSDVWPPFTDEVSRPRFAVELVHAALDRAGVRAVSRIDPDFGEITRKIKAGELDGSAAMWRSSEREEYLLYSRPYFENRLVLVGRSGSDVSAGDLSALPGKRIGVVASYAYGPVVEDARGAMIVEGASDQQNLERLVAGEVDYVLVDQFLIHHLVKQNREKAARLLQIGEKALSLRTLHFAVRRDLPGAETVVERFDEWIKHMMADGTYNRILRIDWIRLDVDGDGTREYVLGGTNAGLDPPAESYDLFASPAAEPGTGMTSGAPATGFYIDGKLYDNWEQVPNRYRTPRPQQQPSVTFLDLSF